MKWLAKINLRVVIERIGAFKSAIFLLTLIAICLFSGYRLGNYYHHFQVTSLEQQKQRLDQLYQQQEQHIERIHTLEVELTVEQIANILDMKWNHDDNLDMAIRFYQDLQRSEQFKKHNARQLMDSLRGEFKPFQSFVLPNVCFELAPYYPNVYSDGTVKHPTNQLWAL